MSIFDYFILATVAGLYMKWLLEKDPLEKIDSKTVTEDMKKAVEKYIENNFISVVERVSNRDYGPRFSLVREAMQIQQDLSDVDSIVPKEISKQLSKHISKIDIDQDQFEQKLYKYIADLPSNTEMLDNLAASFKRKQLCLT